MNKSKNNKINRIRDAFNKAKSLNDVNDDNNGGGGFVIEESENSNNENTIELYQVKEALKLLDLDENDEEVLQTFEQAAYGWEEVDEEGYVKDLQPISWQDFLSIVDVLIDDNNNGNDDDDEEEEDVYKFNEEEDDDDLEYDQDVIEEDDGDNENFIKKSTISKNRPLTQTQIQNSLETFKLFFNNDSSTINSDTILTLSDLRNTVKSLNENITESQVSICILKIITSVYNE